MVAQSPVLLEVEAMATGGEKREGAHRSRQVFSGSRVQRQAHRLLAPALKSQCLEAGDM